MINWQRIAAAALVLVPPAMLAVLVSVYSVNVPFWDQWEFVTIIQKHHQGALTFSDFFAQHNEHRILFPRLIMFVLAVATKWNTGVEVAVNFLLAAGSFWFLYLMIRQTLKNELMVWTAAFVVSLILFSPAQYWNWLWGWQIAWFLNVLSVVVALWALSSWQQPKPVMKIIIAVSAAVIGTFSLASGIFIWLVCLPLLWFSKDLRKFIMPWIVLGAMVVGSYFAGYQDASHLPSKFSFLKHPLEFIEYSFVLIARPVVFLLSASIPTALIYLTMMIGLVWYAVKRMPARRSLFLPWLCLGLYALFAAGSTSVARFSFGVAQAYSSRYITLSSLVLISVCVVLIALATTEEHRSFPRRLSITALALIVFLVEANWIQGISLMREHHNVLARAQHCARTATSAADPCLSDLYPNPEVLWLRLQYLRSIHWGGL